MDELDCLAGCEDGVVCAEVAVIVYAEVWVIHARAADEGALAAGVTEG